MTVQKDLLLWFFAKNIMVAFSIFRIKKSGLSRFLNHLPDAA